MLAAKSKNSTKTLVEKKDLTPILQTIETTYMTLQIVKWSNLVWYRCSSYAKQAMNQNTEYKFTTGVKPFLNSVSVFAPQNAANTGLVLQIQVDAEGVIHITPRNAGVAKDQGLNFSILLPFWR